MFTRRLVARAANLVTVCSLLLVALTGCLPAQKGDPSPAWLSMTRTCESHSNYSDVSSTGKFRGAYQFSRATWDAIAHRVLPPAVGMDPARAPVWLQDDMARALYRISGPGQWPYCGHPH